MKKYIMERIEWNVSVSENSNIYKKILQEKGSMLDFVLDPL